MIERDPSAQEEEKIEELARERLGIPYLYPFQRLVISNILESDLARSGQDSRNRQIVLLPTGSGKSACFQLPALLLSGPSLVVFPLLSLIADQERRLKRAGIACSALRGGMEGRERRRILDEAASGELAIVLTNPEMIAQGGMASELAEVGFRHLVIDEAHCVSEWGETFRPAYLRLGEFIAESGIRIVTAFTATASGPVLAAVQRLLFGDAPAHVISGNPDRPNIRYEVRRCLSRMRETERLCRETQGPRIVFLSSRPGAEMAAAELKRRLNGAQVWFYHAGLSREEKAEIEKTFFESRDGTLVATCAYGMGVDKPDIRTVIHRDMPFSIEAYLQESGRAGRDGRPSRAILLSGPDSPWRRFPAEIRPKSARTIEGYAREMSGCRRKYLLGYLGTESEYCSGCDLCEPGILTNREETPTILRFLRRHSGRLNRGQASRALWDSPSLAGNRWKMEDADEAISSLLRSGYFKKMRHGPWKGRLMAISWRSRLIQRLVGGARRILQPDIFRFFLSLCSLLREGRARRLCLVLCGHFLEDLEDWPFEDIGIPRADDGESRQAGH